MQKLITLIIATLSLVYPALVYLIAERAAPTLFALLFLIVSITKFAISPDKKQKGALTILGFGIVYSLALAISNSELLLRLYPVAISWVIAFLFALSLREEQSLIEQFARLAGKEITPNAKRYTRKLSAFWALLLISNGFAALYLALFSNLKIWALYCGLISYALFACVFLIEWIYRQHYIRKYGA